jgi:predicted TIM-barrel fold metal-dependent hydrolase
MIDNHVHIGHFYEKYYDPLEVIDIVMSSGIEGMSFSSTTSCKDNVCYVEIEKEIMSFLSTISYTSEIIRPFFWYIPGYIKQGIKIKNVFETILYKGIKIHPFAQSWDFENKNHIKTLHSLFNFASFNQLPVLIHTGHSGIDCADRFEQFFSEYNMVKTILAHGRPLEQTLVLLKRYNNVWCDTAFMEEKELKRIIEQGFASRVLLGSDFPITYYYKTHYSKNEQDRLVQLKSQYEHDLRQLQNYHKLLNRFDNNK